MFRKPKRRNANQRQNVSLDSVEKADEKAAQLTNATDFEGNDQDDTDATSVAPPRLQQKSVLTFDDEEEESFVKSKALFGGGGFAVTSKHKIRKRRKEHKKLPNKEEDVVQVKSEIKREIISDEDSDDGKTVNRNPDMILQGSSFVAPDLPETVDSDPIDASERDVRSRFPSSFTDIPDAKAVYEARKKREMMRATGGNVQPVIPLAGANTDAASFGDKHASRSRLVREDDENDFSDDENGGVTNSRDFRFISSKTLLINKEQQRRNEQMEALKLEQGGSDDDELEILSERISSVEYREKKEASRSWSDGDGGRQNSSDEETERWEREQIQKAVGQRKITKLHEEVAAYRRNYYDQNSLVSQDRIVVEDMEIEVVDQPTQSTAPLFINTVDGTLRKPRKYEDMAQLLERLEQSVISRKEELHTKQHQVEQYASNIDENRESITRMTNAQMHLERNFKLYQELKFYTDTVLNCLNEKISEINKIESEIFDLWRTQASDLSQRRAEERNRRRFDRYRQAWDSDEEEHAKLENYKEAMNQLLARASALFDDTASDYCDIGCLLRHFTDWLNVNVKTFRAAYAAECLPKLVGPFVRLQLFNWNPLSSNNPLLHSFEWYRAVLRLGFNNEEVDIEDPAICGLIPDIVEKVVIPKLTKIVIELWDPFSVTQTRRLVEQIDYFVSLFPQLNRESKFFIKLLTAIRQKCQQVLQLELKVPEHLQSLVTEIRRQQELTTTNSGVSENSNDNDIQLLLSQSQSILKPF